MLALTFVSAITKQMLIDYRSYVRGSNPKLAAVCVLLLPLPAGASRAEFSAHACAPSMTAREQPSSAQTQETLLFYFTKTF